MHNAGMATHTHDLFSEDQAGWLEDLHEGLLCLVLHSSSPQLLKETSENLQHLWQQAQAGQIEVFDGQHCQDIIRRFNEQVAAHSASIAALPPDPDRPAHLWVVQRAQALSEDQVHLLGQMLVHLPGVNIRFVLLHEGSTPIANWSDATEGLADVHELLPPPPPPAPEPVLDMLDFAADADNEATAIAPASSSDEPTPAKPSRNILLGATGLAIFALGIAVGRLSAPAPQNTAVSLGASHMPAPTEPASAVIQTSDSNKAAPDAKAITGAATPTAAPAASPGPYSADMQWLRKLPVNSFVVMHDSFTDASAAQAFKGKHAILKTARIVPVKASGQTRYALISGPFRSEERTRGFMSRVHWKKSARVVPRQQVIDDMNAALDN
ncbi:MAG: hypothetical protein RLZ63_935 [Pseudomonadota bacterium]